MSIRHTACLLFWILSASSMPTSAAGLDDADERLFKAQLALAEKGDAGAQYYLGEMHEQGLGTQQNIDEAFKWYAKAAAQGNSWARRKLAHRAEIEAEIKKEPAVEISEPAAPAAEKPKTSGGAAKSAAVATVHADDSTKIEEERIKAERAKRRAAVRAMIIERMRNPVGDPFE